MKKIIPIIALITLASNAAAQPLNSAYFMHEYSNRVEFNPAFTPEYGYASAFTLGEICVSASSNLSPKTLFHPRNGQLVSFLDPSVSSAAFNSAIADINTIDQTFQTNLLSFGFFTKNRSFWSFQVAIKEQVYTSLPGNLFRFLKTGISTGTTGDAIYDMSSLNGGADLYTEYALGYSRNINKRFRIGIRAKYLMGMAHARVGYNNLRLTLNESEWKVNASGSLDIAANGLAFGNNEEGYMDFSDVSFNTNNIGIAGHGFGVDLGGTFTMGGLTIAAAVNDLGLMKWNSSTHATTQMTNVVFNGFNNVDINNPELTIDKVTQDLENEAIKLTQFTQSSTSEKIDRKLRTNVRLSAAYSIFKNNPRNITIGASYNGFVSGAVKRQELFGSIVLSPLSWMSLSGTAGVNLDTNAPFFGAAFNLSPRFLNFFVAIQSASSQYGSVTLSNEGSSPSKLHVPLDELGVNVQFGLSVCFGKSSRK